MKRRAFGLLVPGCLLLLAACTDTTATKVKEPEKPAEPLTGRQAFQQMYPMARAWATDAMPVQLQSINLPQVKATEGTAGAWQGIFFSTSRGRSRTYTWSAVEAEGNLHKGVFAGLEESARPPRTFDVAAIKTDSDAAYKTAVEKSAAYLKKSSGKQVIFILEMTNRFPDLAWRVVWGNSVADSEYSVFVDATTGAYLEKVLG